MQTCPDALEVLEYLNVTLPRDRATAVQDHLALCAACRSRVERNRTLAPAVTDLLGRDRNEIPALFLGGDRERSELFRAILGRERPAELAFGQIWSTLDPRFDTEEKSEEFDAEPRLVMVLDPQDPDGQADALTIAPISLVNWSRAEHDAMVREDESPLGYAFDVQLWNETPMLRQQLRDYLGQLDLAPRRDLGVLYRLRWGDDVDARSARDRVGPAIQDERDARIAAQLQETQAIAYLRNPYFRRVGAQLVEKESEAAGSAVTNAELQPRPSWVWVSGGALHSARLRADIPITQLAKRVQAQGHPEFDYRQLAQLEKSRSSWELDSEILHILATELRTRPVELQGPPGVEYEWPPALLAKVVSLAERRGQEPNLLRRQLEHEVLMAVARGTEGQRPDDKTMTNSLSILLAHLDGE